MLRGRVASQERNRRLRIALGKRFTRPVEAYRVGRLGVGLELPEQEIVHLGRLPGAEAPQRQIVGKRIRRVEQFFDDLWYLNNVLKARREGVSTAVDLMAFDKGIFAGNRRFGIVDKSLGDAKFKLEKLRHAWETLGTHEDETIRDIGLSIKLGVKCCLEDFP